jgi:hypothetical protein
MVLMLLPQVVIPVPLLIAQEAVVVAPALTVVQEPPEPAQLMVALVAQTMVGKGKAVAYQVLMVKL